MDGTPAERERVAEREQEELRPWRQNDLKLFDVNGTEITDPAAIARHQQRRDELRTLAIVINFLLGGQPLTYSN